MRKALVIILVVALSLPAFANVDDYFKDKRGRSMPSCDELGIYECVADSIYGYFAKYTPTVCKNEKTLFIDDYTLVAVSNGLDFRGSDECVNYCINNWGEKCKHSEAYKTSLRAIGDSGFDNRCQSSQHDKVACRVSGEYFDLKICRNWFWTRPGDFSDGWPSLESCAEQCILQYGDSCIYDSPAGITSTDIELPVTVEEPVQTEVLLPETKNNTQKPSSCSACVRGSATWCENIFDPTEGYCTYGNPCNSTSFERSGPVESCDSACTTSRDGAEPSGECVNILTTTTSIGGGYFVSGFCNSRKNAAYQCFIHDETIQGCSSCLSYSDESAWCKSGSTEYCAFGSQCIGDAIESIDLCNDYQTVEVEDGGVDSGAQFDRSDIQQVDPDLWQGFLNWLGVR